MRTSLLFSLVIAGMFPLSLAAEEVVLEGEFVSLTLGQNPEHVISQIFDRLSEASQLRGERDSVAPMFEAKGNTERGGSRICWQEGGERRVANWEVIESSADSARMESKDAQAVAVITVPPASNSFSIDLTWGEGSPLNRSSIEWEWMLEVGGDFFAVPTEDVADHQILPLKDETGDISLHLSEVPRESDVTRKLAEPWWAVVDRNRAFVFACRLQEKDGKFKTPLELRQYSRIQGSTDSFSQTIIIPSAARVAGHGVRAEITLYSGLQSINALGNDTAYQFSIKDGATELLAATSREIRRGEICLYQDDRLLSRWPVRDWTPAQPLRLSVDRQGAPLKHLKNCRLELSVEGREPEQVVVYPEKNP